MNQKLKRSINRAWAIVESVVFIAMIAVALPILFILEMYYAYTTDEPETDEPIDLKIDSHATSK
jgi:hypothetical protein